MYILTISIMVEEVSCLPLAEVFKMYLKTINEQRVEASPKCRAFLSLTLLFHKNLRDDLSSLMKLEVDLSHHDLKP